MKNKSQISVEYMLIVGFATLMAIPLLLIYYRYTADSSDTIATSQALQIARKIADSSESVYYLGKPSQTTLKFSFPDNIQIINLSGREVVFKLKTRSGITDLVQASSVNMSGSIPVSAGIHTLELKAEDGYVQITAS